MPENVVEVVILPIENLNKALATLAKYSHKTLKPAFSEYKVYIPLRESPGRNVVDFIKQELNAEITWMLPDIFPKRKQIISLKKLEKSVGVPIPKSATLVGDILLVNKLPEAAQGREYEIGKVLLKNFGVRAVFLKAEKFNGIQRVASWHKLAGWGDTFTVHRENGCWFSLDISKVFFNPRLSNERLVIAERVERDEFVVDMFAGVGPFAILIKKLSGAQVCAIDINKHAVEFMKLNSKLNKVSISILEGDARLKIAEVGYEASRIIMNYPERSIEFIDSAISVLRSYGFIHVYVFSRVDELESLVHRIEDIVQSHDRKIINLSSRVIEEVSPRRYIYCIDLQVL
ncbi:MAG: methyltransferase [Candidatus Korarchaeota archaeon]|nr:methyltransferase [Thermoproteota archaeon]MCR8462584.1 methyltransferase [Thermoproteota archaeon]MCR8470688.1 methyltransferase [Thermoproteota archaeon]MCR8471710.1 methyltransferase [Thermoproteota archaeon]MCR8472911.1 methyltransferase [Thermoproteota archaeon]